MYYNERQEFSIYEKKNRKRLATNHNLIMLLYERKEV